MEERRKSGGDPSFRRRYLCEMNSGDERIWRAVIVSVGASISQETLTEPKNSATRYIISVSRITSLLLCVIPCFCHT